MTLCWPWRHSVATLPTLECETTRPAPGHNNQEKPAAAERSSAQATTAHTAIRHPLDKKKPLTIIHTYVEILSPLKKRIQFPIANGLGCLIDC